MTALPVKTGFVPVLHVPASNLESRIRMPLDPVPLFVTAPLIETVEAVKPATEAVVLFVNEAASKVEPSTVRAPEFSFMNEPSPNSRAIYVTSSVSSLVQTE